MTYSWPNNIGLLSVVRWGDGYGEKRRVNGATRDNAAAAVYPAAGGWGGTPSPSVGALWETRASTSDDSWASVCWSSALQLFCAVGTNSVATSPDGVRWTARTASVNHTSVCWSPELGLFCAVRNTGTGTRVQTSPDGITWTTRISAADVSWSAVCWSPQLFLFCAVSATGTGNRVMTSPDGVTWTTQTTAADIQYTSICWAAELGLFCAVANTGTGNRVQTSPDGITWTSGTVGVDSAWESVCWSSDAGLFLVVAESGNERFATSRNGVDWTAINTVSLFNSCVCTSAIWVAELGQFVICNRSTNALFFVVSTDGVSFTRLADTSGNSGWRSICYAPELRMLCAVTQAGTGNRFATSSDSILLP